MKTLIRILTILLIIDAQYYASFQNDYSIATYLITIAILLNQK